MTPFSPVEAMVSGGNVIEVFCEREVIVECLLVLVIEEVKFFWGEPLIARGFCRDASRSRGHSTARLPKLFGRERKTKPL